MEIYCNQLGMIIGFSYCLSMNEGLPCRSSVGCWKERMDIIGVLQGKFSEKELREAFGGLPKSRIQRIIESLPVKE